MVINSLAICRILDLFWSPEVEGSWLILGVTNVVIVPTTVKSILQILFSFIELRSCNVDAMYVLNMTLYRAAVLSNVFVSYLFW